MKKKVWLLLFSAPLIIACSGAESSSSRFIPPSESSSGNSSGSSSSSDSSGSSSSGASGGSSSSSVITDEIRTKANEIISAQDSLSSYYEDYTIGEVSFSDGTSSESTYIVSPKNNFHADKKKDGNETYILKINGTDTLITKEGETVTYSTNIARIIAAQVEFLAITAIRTGVIGIFETAFQEGSVITIDKASLSNDELSISLSNAEYLGVSANLDYVFLANGLLKTVHIDFSSSASNYRTYSFSYGNTDLSYPAETPTSSSSQ